MNGLPVDGGPADPSRTVLADRSVARVIDELRRGIPVALDTAAGPIVTAAAETVGPAGLAELAACAADGVGPVLVMSRARASAVLGRVLPTSPDIAALRLPWPPMPEALRGLADPTAAQRTDQAPDLLAAPAGADAVLALAKVARLLPAMLMAPAAPTRLGALLRAEAADVRAHAGRAAATLERSAAARVPLREARQTQVIAFRAADGEHLAIVVGAPERQAAPPLVRIHSECFTGDLLGSLRCDCGPQLHRALRRMNDEGAGVLLYLSQEGRGIGLANKLRAYALQDRGLDTLDANHALGWEADERDFSVAASMLRELGLDRVRLLTNNPRKVGALEAAGIAVERVGHVVPGNGINDAYLATKAARMGHLPDD